MTKILVLLPLIAFSFHSFASLKEERMKAAVEFYNAAAISGAFSHAWSLYDADYKIPGTLPAATLAGESIQLEGAPGKIEVRNLEKGEIVMNGNVFRFDPKAQPSAQMQKIEEIFGKRKYSLFSIFPEAHAGATAKIVTWAAGFYGLSATLSALGCDGIERQRKDGRRHDTQECIMEGLTWGPVVASDLLLWQANKARGHKFLDYTCHENAVTAHFDDGEITYKKGVPTENKSNIPDFVLNAAIRTLVALCPYHIKELNTKLTSTASSIPGEVPAAISK